MRKYKKEDFISLLEKGKSLKEIGFVYGVSKQRIYQILSSLGISTPEQIKKNKYRDDYTEKQKWLYRLLTSKQIGNTLLRMKLIDTIQLPDNCPVLGIKLDYSFEKDGRGEDSPSLDQIVADAGYTEDNMIVISWRANRIKNDGTPEEHRKIADFFGTIDKKLLVC